MTGAAGDVVDPTSLFRILVSTDIHLGYGDESAVGVLGPRDVVAPEVRWKQKNNSKHLYSQVTIKEEKSGELDMWGFSDVVVGEVQNILLQWI